MRTTEKPMSDAVRAGFGAPPVPSAPVVAQAVKLTVGYPNEPIVRDIDFTLPQGQAMALIGTNGSGKSTLLKSTVGLIPTLGGELSIFGGRPSASTRRIAYLGQFHHAGFILPLRAVDVVSMGRFPLHGLVGRMTDEDYEISLAAMRTMGVEKLADTPLRSLSGGQQQRVYLAQVLAHKADLLVMDEPTSGLDAGGRELYLHAMNDELCRGASIIVATHDIQEEATLCQQVMLLSRRVIAFGPPDKVLTPEALLEAFGIVIGKGQRPAVLECTHGHETEPVREAKGKRRWFLPR
jgi:ABC-type Mn2+/Zn2+ transport system ATPase subunit